MLQKFLKTLQRTFFVLLSTNFLRCIKYYSSTSDIVVLVFPNFPKQFLKYFYSDAFANDMALINAVAYQKKNFSLSFSIKKEFKEKIIFYNLGKRFVTTSEQNHSKAVINFVRNTQLANTLFPTLSEALHWENKAYMHQQFNELQIKTPFTVLYTVNKPFSLPEKLSYPFLIKQLHSSSSRGVFKINSCEEAVQIINSLKTKNTSLLLQELLLIDRDLRVIFIDNKVVKHYWRINTSKEWKPTSTKHGSIVDFENYPEKWNPYFENIISKLKLTTGAFDIAWPNNDFNCEPFVLEVSSSYQPNPKPISKLKSSYGKYKAAFNLFKSWDSIFVKDVFYLKKQIIQQYYLNL